MKHNWYPMIRWSSALLCAVLAFSVSALAQQNQLSGEVRDPQHAAVVGVKVKAINNTTQQSTSSSTDAQGEYFFSGLAAGEYTLEVIATGFKPARVDGVKVAAAIATVKNIQLVLAASSESITVNGMELDTNPKTQQQAILLDVPEGLLADSITFTARDIEALHPVSLIEVLQQVPGMEQTFQGRQHMDFGSMRGGSYQVILDGVYVAQADRSLAMIPTQIVESMIIVRDSTALSIGPLAAYHAMGSGGSGVANQGFVIIRTKRANKTESGFSTSASSFATALGHAYIGSKNGNWDFRGAYTYATSAGRDTWNMGYRNGSLTFHGGYTTPGLTADFLYYGTRGMRRMEYGQVQAAATGTSCTPAGVVGGLCATTMNMYRNNGDLVALNVARHWNNSNRTTLQYGFNNMIINSGMAASGSITNEQDSTSANLVLKHTYLLKKNAITAGGQWMKYIAPLGSASSSGYTYYRIDDSMASWFVQDEYHLLGDKLTFDGGVRGDKPHNNWSITKANKGAASGRVDIWNPTFVTLAFGATYKFTPSLSSALRYGKVDSQPASNYVYMDSTGTLSSSLPNQTQHRGEISTNYTLNAYFKANVAVYGYTVNNGTTSATNCTGHTGSSSWTDANGNEIDCVSISPVTTGGTEVGLSGKLAGPFSYTAGYGYLATDNTSKNQSLSHNFANAGLSFIKRNWFAKYSLIYVGPKVMTTVSSVKIYGADYTRSDLNGGYNFKMYEKAMSVTVFGRNLNDNNYATRYVTGAYRDPGRSWGIELATKLF